MGLHVGAPRGVLLRWGLWLLRLLRLLLVLLLPVLLLVLLVLLVRPCLLLLISRQGCCTSR
jgi:hypothetical protein